MAEKNPVEITQATVISIPCFVFPGAKLTCKLSMGPALTLNADSGGKQGHIVTKVKQTASRLPVKELMLFFGLSVPAILYSCHLTGTEEALAYAVMSAIFGFPFCQACIAYELVGKSHVMQESLSEMTSMI